METLNILGQRVKALRRAEKKKQWEMAKQMGCTTSNYQKIEYGQVNIPITSLVLLATHYGVSADYLLGLTDDPKPWEAGGGTAPGIKDEAGEDS